MCLLDFLADFMAKSSRSGFFSVPIEDWDTSLVDQTLVGDVKRTPILACYNSPGAGTAKHMIPLHTYGPGLARSWVFDDVRHFDRLS